MLENDLSVLVLPNYPLSKSDLTSTHCNSSFVDEWKFPFYRKDRLGATKLTKWRLIYLIIPQLINVNKNKIRITYYQFDFNELGQYH